MYRGSNDLNWGVSVGSRVYPYFKSVTLLLVVGVLTQLASTVGVTCTRVYVGYLVDIHLSEEGKCRVFVKASLYNATGQESIYIPATARVLEFKVNGVKRQPNVEYIENGTLITFKPPGTQWVSIELEYETADYHGVVSGLDVFAYGFVPDVETYNFTLTLRLPPGYGVKGVVTVSYTHLTLPTN